MGDVLRKLNAFDIDLVCIMCDAVENDILFFIEYVVVSVINIADICFWLFQPCIKV